MKRYPHLKEALEEGCRLEIGTYSDGTLACWVSKVSEDGKRVLSQRGTISYDEIDHGKIDILASKLDCMCENFLKKGEI